MTAGTIAGVARMASQKIAYSLSNVLTPGQLEALWKDYRTGAA
jgi:hypothetical protein